MGYPVLTHFQGALLQGGAQATHVVHHMSTRL